MFLDFFAPLSRLIKLILMVYWIQYCLAHSNWWFFTCGKSAEARFCAARLSIFFDRVKERLSLTDRLYSATANVKKMPRTGRGAFQAECRQRRDLTCTALEYVGCLITIYLFAVT